jgi:hypothetical protein
MSLPEEHFNDTRNLIEKVDKKKIAKWLLEEGYYPEQYVLPPCFAAKKFELENKPYYEVKDKSKGRREFMPNRYEQINVFFPQSQLTDRTFGLIEPSIYHDIVWYLIDDWDSVIACLFNDDIKIYSYSFPIPIKKQSEGKLGRLRAGRMIYEFIEMAENDLVAEAHKYKYLVKSDIKNFYPSIYTHSLAWALHGKREGRDDRDKFNLIGSKLDKLFQRANDGCTNGIPIGPAISDMVSEILLSAIDRESSQTLKIGNIDFVGVRFKDDYRFLCKSKNDADQIIKTLQSKMRLYNLSLNEGKSEIKELPEGLYRPWMLEYQKYSLRHKESIEYKCFETTLLAVLQIDQKFPDTGIIDKFLSELISKKYNLKLALYPEEVLKVFSLLFLLRERRAKAFPQILAIIELIIEKHKESENVIKVISNSLEKILNDDFSKNIEYQYDSLWLSYFLISNGISKINWPRRKLTCLQQSIRSNEQKFFNSQSDIVLFESIKSPGKNKKLAEQLAVFPKK